MSRGYQPQGVRWVEVPKARKPDQTRRLGILTVRDRVVHAAVKQVLEPVLEPVFLPTSFGFRPGRSGAAALAEAVRLLEVRPAAGRTSTPYTHGLHVDVADCFDTVDHRLLVAELARQVADADVLRLVGTLIRAGGFRLQEGRFGSILRMWEEHWVQAEQEKELDQVVAGLLRWRRETSPEGVVEADEGGEAL